MTMMMQPLAGGGDDNSDPAEDGMAIAVAFREANEEDTIQAMNAQSHSSQKDGVPNPPLKYYVVPATWMRLVWRVVLQHATLAMHNANNGKNTVPVNWRDQVGPIPTQDLLLVEEQQQQQPVVVQRSYALAASSASKPTKTTPAAATTPALRPGLQHEEDYFLLGSNTWLLLSSKFGTNGPILQRSVCFHATQESSIAVVLYPTTETNGNAKGILISLPASGRFAYESSLNKAATAVAAADDDDGATNHHQQPSKQQQAKPAAAAAAAAVAWSQVAAGAAAVAAAAAADGGGGPHQQLPPPAVGNVSDDDETVDVETVDVEDDDMVPALQDADFINNDNDADYDRMSTSDTVPLLAGTKHTTASSPSVLLLPPSTTSNGSRNNNDYWNMSSSDNKDIELGENNENVNIISSLNKQDPDASAADSSVIMSNGIGNRAAVATTSHTSILRYGSGLGNLGNTCFMNSTLQCLGHTHSLQSYFLSGDYKQDLNKDNPLGTGGDLATSFAQLLTEMWWQKSIINGSTMLSSSLNNNDTRSWSYSTSNVIYPRSFKYTVGKHAEQFMGYDQHDSQEFATYLLDALHEDTNRISTKPYVEKPEQADGESDEEAANKAWDLHLKREDSHILEYFMGQVKSKVQCCEEGCGRVSTTFDPFMFLSVPIPGSSERTINLTYVPLNPHQRPQRLPVKVPKSASIEDLCKALLSELLKRSIVATEAELPALEDLQAVDVWQKDIYKFYEMKDDIDGKIQTTDVTYVYELQSLEELKKAASTDDDQDDNGDEYSKSITKIGAGFEKRYKLDLGTLQNINANNQWSNTFSKYLINELKFINTFHKTKGNHEDRIKFYQRLTTFINACHRELDAVAGESPAGQKRAHEESAATHIMTKPNEPTITELSDRCDTSPVFKNVNSIHDVAVLEFCAGKMRAEILQMERDHNAEVSEGVVIYVRFRKSEYGREHVLATPLVMRVASNMTVYRLREELANRLSRSLKVGRNGHDNSNNNNTSSSGGQATSEETSEAVPMEDDNHIPTGGATSESPLPSRNTDDGMFGSPELMTLRQIPLTYDRKSFGQPNKFYSTSSTTLGSIHKSGNHQQQGGMSGDENGGRRPRIASPTDEHESENVAQVVGDQGTVNLEWPAELADSAFDEIEYDAVEDHNNPDEKTGDDLSVLDCIAKYCQMEQLEETEMWYCNKCKKHVRAWKQFHLFRTPPVLIVHLKRFQFTASTHRRDKISRFIDFPLQGLDLTEHVMHWNENEKPIYDCYAVSNHYGGLGGGHYTAHCLNDDGDWCYYDDSRITTHVDPKEAISDAAYVLYYRRRDVADTNQDFLLNIQTPPPPEDEEEAQNVGPAIIMDTSAMGVGESKAGEPSDMSSTNAAVIGEDDTMDVDGTDIGSRSTSPMGSMDGVDDYAYRTQQQHNYGDDDHEDLPDVGDRLPRQ